MKKSIVCLVLLFSMLFSMALPAFATEVELTTVQDDGTSITHFADGSTLTISPVQSVEANYLVRATSQTITKSRVASFTNSNGVLEWKYTLTATFSYVAGVSSTCTQASYTQSIYENGWSFSNGSATKSGNVATGKGTFKHKVLFITTKTYNIDISLTCDKYGNVT